MKVGDIVKVKVLEVDVQRKRISFTMRLDDTPTQSSSNNKNHGGRDKASRQNNGGKGPARNQQRGGQNRNQSQNSAMGNAFADAFAKAKK